MRHPSLIIPWSRWYMWHATGMWHANLGHLTMHGAQYGVQRGNQYRRPILNPAWLPIWRPRWISIWIPIWCPIWLQIWLWETALSCNYPIFPGYFIVVWHNSIIENLWLERRSSENHLRVVMPGKDSGPLRRGWCLLTSPATGIAWASNPPRSVEIGWSRSNHSDLQVWTP